MNRCLIEFDKPENPYTRFLSESANGLRFANLSLYGLVRLINRSVGSGVGQPISLEYGNILERPSGLAESEMVIGGLVGWSSHGVYIIDNRGRVRLTRHTDSGEVAAEWDSLGDMVRAETARIVELLDERGEPLSSHTALMHPEGRRWETAREPLTSVH